MIIFVITLSTFLCIALAILSIYWLTARQQSAMATRLDAMDPSLAVPEGSAAADVVERIASPLTQAIPLSAGDAAKVQKQLMQAGYRSPDAALTFRSVQLISLLVFPSAILMMCFYTDSAVENYLFWGMFAAVFGFYLPKYVVWKKAILRQQRLTWGLADALDLMVITVEAGLGLNAALKRVGEELKNVHPDIHDEFEMVNLEIRVGRSREEALRNLAERTGVDDIRSFVAIMIQADRFGSSIGRAVRIFAEALRTKRRQRAEQAAQKAALKLLFPLTFFLFPTIILAVLGPSILTLMDLLGG